MRHVLPGGRLFLHPSRDEATSTVRVELSEADAARDVLFRPRAQLHGRRRARCAPGSPGRAASSAPLRFSGPGHAPSRGSGPPFPRRSLLPRHLRLRPAARAGASVRGAREEGCRVAASSWVGPSIPTTFPGRTTSGSCATCRPEEILLAATPEDVVAAMALSDADLRRVGRRARARALAEHTAAHRASQLVALLEGALAGEA
ncbi:MAG TPA: glycosyltransferase [Gemmatimonadales bacterium]